MQRPTEFSRVLDFLRSAPNALPGEVVLVLQGGGALGSYQAGVYQALHEAGIEPDWIVGPSIGALAGAADNRYTREMLPALLQSWTPKLLVWGEDDEFQTVDFAERYAREIPETRLVRIKSAGHIPMENDPKAVAGALAEFFAAEARSA
jgi:predicted acylesterase/phospholipase RssA